MTKVRVGIAGCGAVARRHHLPVYAADNRVEVAALCDPAPESVELLKRRFGLTRVRVYSDFEQLLGDPGLDVIDICTPGFTHYQYARLALDAGRHVLLEKPPVYTCAQAEELASLADVKNLKLGVVLNSRYKPLVEQLRSAIESGALGEIKKIQITHHANLVFSESPWLWDERRSKYLLYEFGIHHLDLFIDLCGPHESVLATTTTRRDCVNSTTDLQAIIQFRSGALGILDFTQDSTRHSSYFTHVHVYGTARDAFLRHFPPLLAFSSGQTTPHECVWNEFLAFGRFAYLLCTGKIKAYRNASHATVIRKYIDWIVGGAPYPLGIRDVIPTLRLLSDLESRIPAYQSAEIPVEI